MLKEVKTENIKNIIYSLKKELERRKKASFINHCDCFQNNFKYIKEYLSKDEILSTYDSHRARVDKYYYEIIEENYRDVRFAPSLQTNHDEYEDTGVYIKYYPNLNLYIKLTLTDEISEYELITPVIKLKIEYE